MPMPTPTRLRPKHNIRPDCRDSRANSLELSRLLPLWPHELTDVSIAARENRIALLRRALRAERCRGISGHWTYDLGRHWSLVRCYRFELAAFAKAGGNPNFQAPQKSAQEG